MIRSQNVVKGLVLFGENPVCNELFEYVEWPYMNGCTQANLLIFDNNIVYTQQSTYVLSIIKMNSL